jgi:hypothetical protein
MPSLKSEKQLRRKEMKKIISLALACMMLLSAFVFVSSADEVVDDRYKGDPAKGFGLVQEVQAYVLPTAPTFDFDESGNPTNTTLLEKGAIDTSVWGEPTVVAKASDAATAFTAEPNNNVLFAFESAFDDLYKADPKADNKYTEDGAWSKLSYKLWLAWDNDNFYLAAEIDDPDGYSLKTGNASIWNGDCLQFMLDPLGPNGVMKYANFNYDYKTTCFDWWTYVKPWYNLNTVMNLGVGKVEGLKRNQYQVVNMAASESGTIISDPKTKRNVKFNIVTCDENTVNPGKTVLQLALPWKEILQTASYAGNISDANIGAGYVLGMSASVLNGGKGEKNGEWNSYLNWGSGVTGASMETTAPWFPYVNPGSNAVVLNANSALATSTPVEGAKVAEPIKPVEHVDKVMFCDLGDGDNQMATSRNGMTYDAETGIAAALDMAITAVDPTDVKKSLVGWWIGDFFSIYAGYDISEKTFVFAQQDAGNGLNRDVIIKRSDVTFDWQVADPDNDKPAEWHRLGIKIKGDTAELYCDGTKVLEATDSRFGHHIISEQDAEFDSSLTVGAVGEALTAQPLVLNNTAACVFDNYVVASYDYNLAAIESASATTILGKFTFDSDDPEWNASPMRDVERALARVIYAPLDKEGDAYYAEKAVAPAYTIGDVNGDNKLNAKDVTALMKFLVGAAPKGFVEAAADYDGNGKVNAKDVTKLMKDLVSGK